MELDDLQNELHNELTLNNKININNPRCQFCAESAIMTLFFEEKDGPQELQPRGVCPYHAGQYKNQSKKEMLTRNVKSNKKKKNSVQ